MLTLLACMRVNLVLRATMARPLALWLAAPVVQVSFKTPKHKPHAKTARLVSTAMWLQPHVHHARRGSTRLRVQAVVPLVMQAESQLRMARQSAQVALLAPIAPR